MPLFHVPSMVDVVTDQKKTSVPWLQLWTNLFNLLNQGYPSSVNNLNGQAMPQSTTISIVKLTVGGTNGSLTFTNGILTGATPPT
jgi:hypothetical protein